MSAVSQHQGYGADSNTGTVLPGAERALVTGAAPRGAALVTRHQTDGKEKTMNTTGLEKLINRISLPGELPYGEEAPVRAELERMSYLDLRSIISAIEEDHGLRLRAHIRYLAALLPSLDRRTLAEAIHAVIGNRSISRSDVRLVLDGRSLADPTRRTNEPPIERVQMVGRLLANGSTYTDAAEAAGVSFDLVQSIDRFLGITDAIDERRMNHAVAYVREGMSVREFAASAHLSHGTAHRYMQRARAVLVELGELQ